MSNIKFYAPVDFDDTSSGVTIDGDLAVDTDTLFVDVSADKVGIGTTSPLAHLHIKPSSSGNTFSNIDGLLVENNGSSNSYYALQVATAGGGKSFNVTNAGNVGIGTTSPGAPLEIATTGTGDSLLITNTDATSSASPVITLNRNSASPADGDYLGQIKFKGENDTSGSIVYAKITAKISDASATTEDGLIETAIHSNSSNVIVSRQTGTDLKLINGVGLQVDGDVGIGTTSPSQKLQVSSGDIMIDSGNAIHLTTTADHTKVQRSNNGLELFAGSSARVHVNDGGNVGIGTTSPSDKLTVNGNISIFGNKIYNGSASNSAGIDFGDSQVDLHGYYGIRFFASTAGIGSMTERMRVVNNGNVLIGTTTDSGYKLQVSGDVEVSDSQADVLIKSTTAGQASRLILNTTAREWRIGTHSGQNNSLWIYDATAASYRLALDTSGNLGVGTTSPSHKLHVNGGNIFGSSNVLATNNVYAAGPQGFVFGSSTSEGEYIYRSGNDIRIHANSGDRLTVLGTGDVGIGTTSPDYELDVAGDIGIDGYMHHNGDDSKIGFEGNDAIRIYTANSVAMQIDSSQRVGIGTTSPDQLLHVSGNTKTTNLYVASDIIHEGDTDTKIQFNTDIINFDTAGLERLRIAADGNVGIGTGSPNHALDVYSNENVPLRIHRPSNANLDSSGAWGIGFSTRGDANTSTSDTRAGIFSYYNGNLFIATSTSDVVSDPDASARLTVTAAGNVGIGTMSPSSLLQVQSGVGNTQLDGHQILLSRAGNNHIFATNASGVLALGTNNAEKMRITSGGNVLIGTTTDSGYKLDVSGSIHAQYAHVDEYIYHSGDTNTAVRFLDDSIQFNAGGVAMMKLTEGSADIVTINPDSADVNFQVNGDTVANLLFVDGGTSKVGIGTSSPAYRLDIKGTSNNIGDGNQIFSVGNTSGGTQLAIGSSEDSYTWIRSYESGVGGRDLALVTNNEAVRIKSGGNVLIGTTTDGGFKLDVNGTATFRDDVDMRTNAINFKTNGSSLLPQFFGHRSATDLDSRDWTNEGGWAYTTFDSSSSNTPSGSLHNANGLLSFNTHVGDYGHQIAMTTATNKLHFRTRNAAAWQSWQEITTDSKDFIPAADSTYDIGTNTVRFANGYFDTLYGDGSNLTGITATETDTLDSVTGRGSSTTNSITVGGLTVDTSTLHVDATNNRVGVGTASPSNKLHIVGDLFLKGSNTSSSTKVFHVQTGNSTSIMDFRNDAYAFFGCGQGGGSASGFIFRYNSTFGVQFTGYNYGNGSSPSYKPILMDTDLAGRSQGVYVNYGITGYTAPAPTTTTEFAVRGRGTSTSYTAKFEDSSTNPLLYIKDNGNVTVGSSTDNGYKLDVNGNTNTNGDYYVNGNQGWSGTINIPTNPPISITVEGGIITNVT